MSQENMEIAEEKKILENHAERISDDHQGFKVESKQTNELAKNSHAILSLSFCLTSVFFGIIALVLFFLGNTNIGDYYFWYISNYISWCLIGLFFVLSIVFGILGLKKQQQKKIAIISLTVDGIIIAVAIIVIIVVMVAISGL